ncbi:NAD(P)H-dependent oxidoreductase subunit E [Acanthopleuribacter pedis]|uniref:NAD(P)H-dependent oxidoreductase subunit E n=1 Tax=Acanthopleuribacter pedis TaxID=442870 RepID=A0A8J7Q934_9BACT|nr:NAD(P)H-dependent oxidoreductase subunit E [Acanthopleuribacter pedis]MBO1319189.1 NAD(P)H-dependent oxidoreductase subunit E [Acanthopleuribacter pedis]
MAEDMQKLHLTICRGPSCGVMGSDALVAWCADLNAAGLPVSHEICGCTGNCTEAPVIELDGRYVTEVSPEKLTEILIERGIS